MRKITTYKSAALAAVLALVLPSCFRDMDAEQPEPRNDDRGTVTFVVSVPSSNGSAGVTRAAAGGGNVHFPDGVPADYRNYSADADTVAYGTVYGGYPDAEAEAAAFERAVAAMTANYEKSRAANRGAGAPATRAIEEGSPDDNLVEELAILLFDGDGNYLNMIGVGLTTADRPSLGKDEPELIPTDDPERWQFTLEEMADGVYTAIFIANSRNEVDTYIGTHGAADPAMMTIEGFRTNLKVNHKINWGNVWNAYPDGRRPSGHGVYRPFPMSSQPVAFTIPADRDYSRQPVELVRALAKINIVVDPALVASEKQFRLRSVELHNYSVDGRLIPSAGWNKSPDLFDEQAAAVNATGNVRLDSGGLRYSDDNDDSDVSTEIKDMIFVYEQAAVNDDSATDWQDALSLVIHGDIQVRSVGNVINSSWRIALLKTDPEDENGGNPKHVHIVRNHTYTVTIKDVNTPGHVEEPMDGPPAGLVYEIDAHDEEDGEPGMNDNLYNGMYQLTVDRSTIVVGPEAGSAYLRVYTDYVKGIQAHNPTVLGSSFTPCEFAPYTGADFAGMPGTLELNITRPNNSGSIKTATVWVSAGILRKPITVIQLPRLDNVMASGVPSSTVVTGYAGAFWRADQRGERLIGLNPDVDWWAFALDCPDGDDWVVMDSKPSRDGNVLTQTPDANGNDDGFDREHNVESTVNWAAGSTGASGGYFRIGLNSAHAATPDDPARYSVVLVAPGRDDGGPSSSMANYRLLFLRQGHDPDYLMQPGDAAVGITPSEGKARPLARKLSPYNLTAEAYKTGGTADWYSWSRSGPGATNPSEPAFTDYPTQAGAYFKWGNSTEEMRAFRPNGTISDWGEDDALVDFGTSWDDFEDAFESCPPGYRRPSEGHSWENISFANGLDLNLSEMFQSLSLNMVNGGISGNSVSGHYADGFFDRRSLNSASAEIPAKTAVAFDSPEVAYTGRLYYNSATGANLFLPFAGGGYKNYNEAYTQWLVRGIVSRYWTTGSYHDTSRPSTSSNAYGIRFEMFDPSGGEQIGHIERIGVNSIRCVVATDITQLPNLVLAPPGVIGIRHSELSKPLEHRSLTIRGSSTYKGTWVDRNIARGPEFSHLGGLEDEPVYMVYFKWGSTVAMIGGTNGDSWNSDDVAWVAPGHDLTNYPVNSWNTFSPAEPTGYGTGGRYDIPDSPESVAKGWGDACDFVGGATRGNRSGWKTPTGGPWKFSDGVVTSTPFGTENGGWNDVAASWRTDTFGGVSVDGAVTDDGTIYLPATGSRFQAGSFGTAYAGYWTSSSSSVRTDGGGQLDGWRGYYLRFLPSQAPNVGPASDSEDIYGFPIRCVRPIPVRTDMVMAPPGVIGIKKSDFDDLQSGLKTPGDGTCNLTIKGSSTYAGTWVDTDIARGNEFAGRIGGLESEPVYAVYFKWGSMVAMTGGNGDEFDRDDVVWVNEDFDLANLTDRYDSFTPAASDPDSGSNNIVESDPEGHGDPCSHVNGADQYMRWMTPRGNPWMLTGNNSAFSDSSSSNPHWTTDFAPWNGGVRTSPGHSGGHVYLPAAGFRDPGTGTMSALGTTLGQYWSTSAVSGQSGHSHALKFTPAELKMMPGDEIDSDTGVTVRCTLVPVD